MAEPRDLSVVLTRLAAIARVLADGVSFVDADGTCRFCGVTDPTTEALTHEIWCAWVIGRQLSASDIIAVERLARVLAYRVG